MPRSFGVVFLVALMAWALLGLFAGRALGNHVRCGDVITQDTTLDSDLIDCPGDGIVIGASDITLDLGDGIYLGPETGDNVARRNFTLGNCDDGVDGGGNRAFANGNPLQCLNVACR
jgi:hypothetical protein